jgi:hypothetical protein
VPEDVEEQPVVPEVIVSQPPLENHTQPAEPLQEVTPAEAMVEPASAISDAPSTTNNESQDGSAPKDPAVTASGDASPSPSSWWTYLGLSAATSTASVNDQQPKPEQPPVMAEPLEPEPSAVTMEKSAVVSDSAETKPPLSNSPASDSSLTTAQKPVAEEALASATLSEAEKPDQQTPSLFSAETAKSQASAWYSPWGWYAASPIAPSSSNILAGGSVSDNQSTSNDTQTDQHQMTESQMVMEEALARDSKSQEPVGTATVPLPQTPIDVVTPEPPTTPASPLPLANPIETSIATNKSGWVSFLMSKALLVKNITDGQDTKTLDQGEMEVMDIDDDDDQEAANTSGGDTSTATVTQSEKQSAVISSGAVPSKAVSIAAARKPRSIASTTPSASTSPKPQEPPRPPTKEREPKKSGPPAPPLTSSDSIKKETSKVTASGTRSPSPTPSKASMTPPRTSPPNLVLPTWDDTFLSPPRSLVPPAPTPPPPAQKGKLEKTLRFMSGVLWSGQDEKGGSVKGKEREKEREHPFLQFGMELPKALDVVGQAFDPSSLHEKCRVVVIGVAGWMPGECC